MLAKAVELAQKHGWFLVRQFENEANAEAHTRTTALEILDVFRARQLDYFVTGYGTGGTLKGVGRVLRQRSPHTRIVVCEPDNSPLLGSGIPQAHAADGSPAGSHPSFRPHLMQGWTPDFIPKLTADAVAMKLIDQVLPVNGNRALEMARELARQEGIFCGTSGGATFAGAMAIAEQAPPNTTILCMLPDTGERYLSTPLFEGIPEQMTEDEMQISRSTPGYRFDLPAAAAATSPPADSAPVSASAEDFVDAAIGDPDNPVVLFALEWCEFCWAVRKLFGEMGVALRAIDLDRRVPAGRLGRPDPGRAAGAAGQQYDSPDFRCRRTYRRRHGHLRSLPVRRTAAPVGPGRCGAWRPWRQESVRTAAGLAA
jgi:cysteine synthase A